MYERGQDMKGIIYHIVKDGVIRGKDMKRKHTIEFLNKWLKVNGFTLYDLGRAYHRNTGHRATVGEILKDSTTKWRYYLNVC